VATLLNGSRRTFAGTQTAIYEALSGSWTDRSKGGGYVGGPDTYWRWTQFGDATIATNKADPMQESTSAAFSDVPTAPKASIVESVQNFVFAFSTNDATFGDSPDRWWCCALGNQDSWTPSIASQAATGRFIDAPGEIRAGRSLGNNIIAYKERAMWIGTYQGPPIIWDWQNVSRDVGAVSQEAVVNIGTAHIFLGADDFWIYDGSRPQSIGGPIRKWFNSTVDPSYRNKTLGVHDRAEGIVRFHFVSLSGAGSRDSFVAYNYLTQQWGYGSMGIEAAAEYSAAGITWAGTATLAATWDALPAIAYDSPFWNAGSPIPAVVGTDHVLKSMSDVAASSGFTLAWLGDDEMFSTVTRARLRLLKAPTTAIMTHNYGDSPSDTPTMASSSSLNDGKFDALWSARWHQLVFAFTGDIELGSLNVTVSADGGE
jgi:hypothetical protein